jgi:hypothetical protein
MTRHEPETLMKMDENRARDFGEFLDSLWATAGAATRFRPSDRTPAGFDASRINRAQGE